MGCEVCGEYAEHMHHVSYEPEETVPLCKDCHHRVHHEDGFHDELEPDMTRGELREQKARQEAFTQLFQLLNAGVSPVVAIDCLGVNWAGLDAEEVANLRDVTAETVRWNATRPKALVHMKNAKRKVPEKNLETDDERMAEALEAVEV